MKEHASLEVKEAITNTFLKTVSAYANYGTGIIQFGITDNGDIVGVQNSKDACLVIENKINDSIQPRPNYHITVDENTHVITLKVLEGASKPYYYHAKAYKRNDTSTVEVDRLELNRLILQGANQNFDELPAKDTTLHFSVLEAYMKRELHIAAVNNDILRTVGLETNEGVYNNAGALIADTNNFSGIDCARFGANIDTILQREVFQHMSLLSQYDKVIKLYQNYYQYDVINGALRKTVETVPEKAFREAIANALVHRTWDVPTHIRVAMFDDRIEIYSPGGLPRGITQEEYLNGQVSLLRNPLLGALFFRLHIIENFGTGVARMRAAYEHSLTKPIHEFSDNTIKVTLPLLKDKHNLLPDEALMYEHITNTVDTSSKLASATAFGKNKTLKLLGQLTEKGYITKFGNGRGTRYKRNA